MVVFHDGELKCHRFNEGGGCISFLKKTVRECPKGKTLHVAADNLAVPTTKKVRGYLASKRGRLIEHFIQALLPWLNLVERWFREITTKRIRWGSCDGSAQIKKAQTEIIKHWNKSDVRFTLVRTTKEIKEAIKEARSGYGK